LRNEKCLQNFGPKPERKRSLGRHRCSGDDNIRMDLQDIIWEGVDWKHLFQDKDQWRAVVNSVIHSRNSFTVLVAARR
jgi:hypothetical protein